LGEEARRFHPEGSMEGVERHGLERGEMRRVLEGLGFGEVRVEKALEREKEVETVPGSGVMDGRGVFPFLVCLGRKPE